MNLSLRKRNAPSAAKSGSLTNQLRAIGVQVSDVPTRDDISRAHRIFRGARGLSVQINVLWTRIKNHVCPVCDGIKLRAKAKTCGYICGMDGRETRARSL